MFINKKILLKSGNGGNGKINFSLNKNKNIADGGDGGDGGDIFLLSNNKFKFINKNNYFSNNGKNGEKNNKKGCKGKNVLIKIPIGVIITIKKIKIYIIKNNFFLKILNGGKGGKGNNYFKKLYYNKIATNGSFGKTIFLNIYYIYFLNNCYVNLSNNFLKLNNFNYKKNFISKIYIFFINYNVINFFYKILKFFLFFLYIKNFNFNNYWIIINICKKKILKKISIISPIFFVSNIFLVGFKKIFHYLKIWKNS